MYRSNSREVALVILDEDAHLFGKAKAYRALRSRDPELPIIVCKGKNHPTLVTPLVASDPHTAVKTKPFRLPDIPKEMLKCPVQHAYC